MSAANEPEKPTFRVVVLKESDLKNKVQYAWKPIRLTSGTAVRLVSEDTGLTNSEANSKLVTMIKKIKTEPSDPVVEISKPSTSKCQTSVPGFVIKTDPLEDQHLEFETAALDSCGVQSDNQETLEKVDPDENEESSEKLEVDESGCDEIEPSADMDQSFLEPEAADVYANIGYNYPQSNFSSSSSEDEDSRLAQQLLDLETQFQQKEAQNQLVRKTKLEALEAGIKFIGALFNYTGLGSLRVPINSTTKKKTASPESNVKREPKSASPDNTAEATLKEKTDLSDNYTPAVNAHELSVLDDQVAAVKEDDCDLGVFNPAELTRKMKQFISGEDSNIATAKRKQKNKRLAYKTKLYKHHRRRENKIEKIKERIKIPAVKIKVELDESVPAVECANNEKNGSLINGELANNLSENRVLDDGVVNSNEEIEGSSPVCHKKPSSMSKEVQGIKRPSIQELRHRLLLEEITAPRSSRPIMRPRGRGRGRPPLVSRRYDPILKPSFIPSGVENNQEHRVGIVKSIVRKESKLKRIEMNNKTINLAAISQDTETDEQRNRRLLELANATASMSIKHQMTRNSCIDDLFQSSLFQSPDL